MPRTSVRTAPLGVGEQVGHLRLDAFDLSAEGVDRVQQAGQQQLFARGRARVWGHGVAGTGDDAGRGRADQTAPARGELHAQRVNAGCGEPPGRPPFGEQVHHDSGSLDLEQSAEQRAHPCLGVSGRQPRPQAIDECAGAVLQITAGVDEVLAAVPQHPQTRGRRRIEMQRAALPAAQQFADRGGVQLVGLPAPVQLGLPPAATAAGLSNRTSTPSRSAR